jgi:hypothetical protein
VWTVSSYSAADADRWWSNVKFMADDPL